MLNVPGRPGRDELYKLYWIENKTLTQIARVYKVSRTTVKRWMKMYSIQMKNMAELMASAIKKLGPEKLRELFLVENKTRARIASMYGVSCSTVKKWLRIHGIRKRNPRRLSSLERPSRDELYRLYWNKNMSSLKTARMYGVSYNTVLGWMKKYNIPRRNWKEAFKLMAKPFTPQPGPELAYVLGVLLGDGSVYVRHKPDKRTYHIQLNVKDKEFAEKFARALQEIGLRPSPLRFVGKGYYQVMATSKNFYEWYRSLCFEVGSPDLEKIRSWIKGFENHFARGFYESEGSISFHKFGKLRARIGNRQKERLLMVKNILEKCYGIKSHLCGPGKHNYFELVIYGDERVSKFLTITRPCIKTEPKKNATPL